MEIVASQLRFTEKDGTTEVWSSGPRIDIICADGKHRHFIADTASICDPPIGESLGQLARRYDGIRVTGGSPELLKKLRRQVEDRLRKDSAFLGRVIGLHAQTAL